MPHYFLGLLKACILLHLLVFSNAYCQEISLDKDSDHSRFFNRIQIGYGLVPNSGYAFERDWENDEVVSERTKKFSYGKGFNFGYSGGIWINKNVGVELGFSYLIGGRNKLSNSYKVDTVPYPYYDQQQVEEKVNLFRFGPGLIIKGDMNKISPYGRLNIWYGIGKGKWEIEENVRYNIGGTSTGTFEWDVKGIKAFGFASAFGIAIECPDKKSEFFMEFSYVGMGGTWQKASKTMHIIDGKSYLKDLPVSEREIIYVDEIDYTDSQNQDMPKKVVKTRQSFSNYGFNIGFMLRIK